MYIKIIQLILAYSITLAAFSQNSLIGNSYSQNRRIEQKEFPWPTNGKFLITKILISPNIYSWQGDRIGSNFQNENSTDLSRYLLEKFEIDTLGSMYVYQENLFIKYDSLVANKPFLDSCKSIPMQPIFKPSKFKIGSFTYEIPILVTENKEAAKGLFIGPGNQFIIDRDLKEISKNGEPILYHIKIETEMTHYIDRATRKKLIPLFSK